ncbi:MAG: DUF4250 domain-containing protein [Faecalibacterium sp.]|nr:DUF4250 domain-containing protein [Faecalibacterium sp.]
MPLPKDPILLYSTVNMLLRDRYASLDALCEDQDVCQNELCAVLEAAGYHYFPAQNQFR